MNDPKQIWWSAAELAEAGLPDMPGTKRKVNDLAKRESWDRIEGKARRRKAAGGGTEYHWSVLPLRARLKLSRDASASRADAGRPDAPEEAWTGFEGLTDKAKKQAQNRLIAIQDIEELEGAGLNRSLAVPAVSERIGVSVRTLWNWLKLIEGVAHSDRLTYLAPRHQMVKRKPRSTPVDPEFFELLKGDFLRPEPTSFTASYDRSVEIATAEGIPVPPLHQVRRHYKKLVSKPTEIFWRKGAEALRRFYPHQTRDKTAMVPLECVQGDYHKFDVFVLWPGEDEPIRVQGVFFSDVYSGKMLAWRLSPTANSHTVQLTLGDLIDKYGIPQSALLDNGREFAAKVITGGTPTRFRFTITDEDIPGLLPLLGVKVHWATPYSGQSKPIERAFRDFCDRISMHPAFSGAYTGNKPDAKPENYASRAIPLEEFRAIVDAGVEAHNARPGRRSEVAFGRSFNDVFNEGYKTAPIQRATEEQRRMWLLRAEGLNAKATNGELTLFGSRYWAPWAYEIAGQKVVARFDPDDLHAGIEVYRLDGSRIGSMACVERGDFLSVEDAKTHNSARNAFIRAEKKAAKAAKKVDTIEIAARLRAAGEDIQPEPVPEAEVVRMPTPHKVAPKPDKRSKLSPDEIDIEEQFEAQILRLSEHQERTADQLDPDEIHDRAIQLENLQRDGTPLTPEQHDWLSEYQLSAEYRGRKRLARAFNNND